jgi:hypothetical protein
MKILSVRALIESDIPLIIHHEAIIYGYQRLEL